MYYDSLPAAFKMSYSLLCDRTQNQCQVTVVKPVSLGGGEQGGREGVVCLCQDSRMMPNGETEGTIVKGT